MHFLGRLSSDAFGAQLRGHIDGAGVALDLATESSQATSIAVVSLDDEGDASYTFHFADTANFGWQDDDLPTLVQTTGCTSPRWPAWSARGARCCWTGSTASGRDLVRHQRPATVITDPEEYWAKVQPWLRVVGQHRGILKASDEDVEFLAQVPRSTRCGSGGGAGRAGWTQYGIGSGWSPSGPDGAVAVEPGRQADGGAGLPDQVVDTVGAGDTFMAGFLDGYVGPRVGLEAALTRGAAAASIVCSRRGAQPPTAAEVDALVGSARAGLGLTLTRGRSAERRHLSTDGCGHARSVRADEPRR